MLLNISFLAEHHTSVLVICKVLVSAFTAVLFIQTGLDKMLDWRSNQDYLASHFANTPLSELVILLLPLITIMELLAGFSGLIGIVRSLTGDDDFTFIGLAFGALSILSLFFGQRVAKNYDGAASLVPYFLVMLFGLFLVSL